MPLLSLSHVTAHYGGPILFRDITLDVEKGQKIGVIGQNGTGKSTLLRMLGGMQEPQDGSVIRQRGLRIAFQAQELDLPPESTVWSQMEAVFADDLNRAKKLAGLEAKLAEAGASTDSKLLDEYGRLQAEHEAAGGWLVKQRISSVLTGLGLPESAWHQPIRLFSGGERNVIGLARIILLNPDVMLLDEPSNHLDLDGVEWFIRFIRQTDAAVVMVSHNRHMLDACVDSIWEVRQRKVSVWAGNYSDFMRQKEEALALQERQYKNQQRLIRRLEFQIRRLKDFAKAYDDPGQAKRAKVMERRIEQMDKVEKVNRNDRRFHATLGGTDRHGRIALTISGLTFGYPIGGEVSDSTGDHMTDEGAHRPSSTPLRLIFDDASIDIEQGERVALVGPNGSGKTTLFKLILEEANWENPVLRLGKSCQIGEYRQFHEEALDSGKSLLDWACETTGLLRQPASELLHRFLFSRDDLDRPIATLSGGEKSRLQLAKLVHQKVNFLMLDEPTNHLDIQACEQLEEMLEEFDGTLLVISHDRYFLDRLVTRVVEVKERGLVTFDGPFALWWEERQAEAKAGRAATLQLHSQREAEAQSAESAREEHERRKAAAREREQMKKRLRSLESKITQMEARKADSEAKLAAAYAEGGDPKKAESLAREHADLQRQLTEAYAEWERIGATIEAGG